MRALRLAFAGLVFLLAACGGGSTDGSGGVSNPFTCTVDGKAFSGRGHILVDSYVHVSGYNDGSPPDEVDFVLPLPAHTGTYALGTTPPSCSFIGHYDGNDVSYGKGSGTLNVTSWDAATGTMKGTFSFTAQKVSQTSSGPASVNVTGGSFTAVKDP